MILNLSYIKIKNYTEAELIVHSARLKILPLTDIRLTKEYKNEKLNRNINRIRNNNFFRPVEPLIEFTKNFTENFTKDFTKENFTKDSTKDNEFNIKKAKGILNGGEIFCFIKKNIKRWTDLHDWSTSKSCKPKNTPSYVKQILKYYEIPKTLTKTYAKKRIEAGAITFDSWKKNLKMNVKENTLQKKTITLSINEECYQIVSYYRDSEAKYSLLDLVFFQKLKKKLEENENLMNDEYVNEQICKGIDFKKELELPDIVSKDDIIQKEIIASKLLSELNN